VQRRWHRSANYYHEGGMITDVDNPKKKLVNIPIIK
jgi:hypothetical protein